MKVPDVTRNPVPDTWTADIEGALAVNWVRVPMTTAALVVEERSWRRPWRFFSVEFGDIVEVCWPTLSPATRTQVVHSKSTWCRVWVL